MSDPNRKAEKARLTQESNERYSSLVATLPQFVEFPKISRLNRDITITEKLDGTNAAIGITDDGMVYAQSRSRIITPEQDNYGFAAWVEKNKDDLRSVLGPGLHFGEWWGKGIQRGYDTELRRFSLFNYERWSNDPSVASLAAMGVQVVPILYHGPWMAVVGGMDVHDVYPVRDENGKLSQGMIRFAPDVAISQLKKRGSVARPGYKRVEVDPHTPGSYPDFDGTTEKWYRKGTGPEGVVVFHKAGRMVFKVTIENDEQHKFQLSNEELISGLIDEHRLDEAMKDDELNPNAEN